MSSSSDSQDICKLSHVHLCVHEHYPVLPLELGFNHPPSFKKKQSYRGDRITFKKKSSGYKRGGGGGSKIRIESWPITAPVNRKETTVLGTTSNNNAAKNYI